MARNILVVEDDHNISDLIRMYLEKEGFEVRIAYDGGKAVEEFDREAPDMVLLDIMLPVMDGWAVCAKIRETSKVPIIMLTAKGGDMDKILGLEYGADDYISKPFNIDFSLFSETFEDNCRAGYFMYNLFIFNCIIKVEFIY